MATRAISIAVCSAVLLGTGMVQAGAQPRSSGVHLEPAALRRIVEALAHDSMAGRPTPSPELDRAGAFVAQLFRESGVSPLGDDGEYFQRYPVIETLLSEDSTVLQIGDLATWRFGKDFFFGGGFGGSPRGELRGSVVVVTGATTANAGTIDVRGKVVVYLPPRGTTGRPDYGPVFALGRGTPAAIIVPGAYRETTWSQLRSDRDELKPFVESAWPYWGTATAVRREGFVSFIPIIELWAGRITQFIQAAGLDSSVRSADGSPKVTPLDAQATLRFRRQIERLSWPSNVVGVVRGSDPALQHEYVVVTAHLDGLGRSENAPPGPGSVLNGADDNASGVAAMVQIAKAMSTGTRPKRSVIFVAVSGEELGLWGSDYFASRLPVPKSSVVATVNLDMIGRARGDTVFVTGLADAGPGRVARDALQNRRQLVLQREADIERRYPGESFDSRSDHANFRRRGVPAISFFTGWHDDYHTTTDDADKLDYATLSRIANSALDVVMAIGNAR